MTEDLINKKGIYFPTYAGSNDYLKALLNQTSKIICNWFSDAEKYGPLPNGDNFECLMPDLRGDFPDEIFFEIEKLISNSFNPVHPGSLAHLDPPPLCISVVGDLIAASLNNNLLAYELSPSITYLEESLCKWFSKKIGFPDSSGGIAASGGTLSNLNALVASRNNAGLGSNPDAVVLISEDAHSSFIKCIKIMGLKENNLIRVKTDKNGCMDLDDLQIKLSQCYKENKKIFCMVATLGTTIRGAIDPIKDISEICKDRNIWLHIDGSIGGIYAITNIPIVGLNNIEQANSITINPQKILGITKTSSLLLIANFNVLKNTFSTGLPYISSNSNVIDRGEIGVQGSRPAEIIKLWLGLRFLGLEGVEDILYSSKERKEYFEKNLNTDKFDIYSGPLHISSFLPKGMSYKESDNWTDKMKSELLKRNFVLSRPRFKNKFLLRAVFGNYNTSDCHIENLSRLLNTE